MARFPVFILLNFCFLCIDAATIRKPQLREDVMIGAEKKTARLVIDQPTIEDINGPIAQYLYEGDMVVSSDQLEKIQASLGIPSGTETSSLRATRHKRGAPVVTALKWSKHQPIAFSFSRNIAESVRRKIRLATSKIAANTCLNFKEDSPIGTQIRFHRGFGCWSYVGMDISIEQPISIGAGCDRVGIISHEIMHALGFSHTHNRNDRDDFVTVKNELFYDNNFAKLSVFNNDNLGVPYDFGSVMHYRAGSFAHVSMAPKDADYINTMGQHKYLPFNDYKIINLLYKCSEHCLTQPPCQNGGYPSPKDCNLCVCGNFYTGMYCEVPRETLFISSEFSLVLKPGPNNIVKTSYRQDFNFTLNSDHDEDNWELFGKDEAKIIRAPEGRLIRVTIDKFYADFGELPCIRTCPLGGVEIVDTENGDLTAMGKIFCCGKDEGYSFVSKSNVIGYKAYASPGMLFEAVVTYIIE